MCYAFHDWVLHYVPAMEAALFPQLPEEELSERNVNLILFTYFSLVVVSLPLMQVALAYAYVKQNYQELGRVTLRGHKVNYYYT